MVVISIWSIICKHVILVSTLGGRQVSALFLSLFFTKNIGIFLSRQSSHSPPAHSLLRSNCFSPTRRRRPAEEERALLRREEEAQRAEADKYRYLPRTVLHPLFRNCSGADASAHLAARSVGECVVRPSTRGVDHLTVTWKFRHAHGRNGASILFHRQEPFSTAHSKTFF